MIILGLNLRHGDSSACLLKNGKLVCAAEEERFVKVKHCSHFPINAIKYCLNQSGILAEEIDYITHNSKKNYNLINKMNFRTGSAANSDFFNIYITFIESLWSSQSTMLMGYSGGVISYVMPMVGIIYFMTEVFTNLFN